MFFLFSVIWMVFLGTVKTGKYRPGDESRSDVVPPDEVVGSFAEWVDQLLEGDVV